MFRLIRSLIKLAIFVAFIYLMMYFFGSQVPREQTAMIGTVIHAPQTRVWDVLVNPQSQLKWRSGHPSVTPQPSRDGHPCWLETTSEHVTICETSATPPSSRATETVASDQFYTAKWAYRLTPVDDRTTEVLLTETSKIASPIWRFVGHYIARQDTVTGKADLDGLKFVAERP